MALMDASATQIEFVEDGVPLSEIGATASDVIRMHGGEIRDESENLLRFSLPQRQGSSVSGFIDCALSWVADGEVEGEGTVTVRADRESSSAPRPAQLALLIAGVIGSGLWIMWPFFPHLGPAAFVGGLLAFSCYVLTSKKTRPGVVWNLLQRVVEIQREDQSPEA